MSSKAASIQDVSKETGMSLTTVSFVLNGKAKTMGISDETIANVQRVVKK
jgi:LacI family transcriptional regulator